MAGQLNPVVAVPPTRKRHKGVRHVDVEAFAVGCCLVDASTHIRLVMLFSATRAMRCKVSWVRPPKLYPRTPSPDTLIPSLSLIFFIQSTRKIVEEEGVRGVRRVRGEMKILPVPAKGSPPKFRVGGHPGQVGHPGHWVDWRCSII